MPSATTTLSDVTPEQATARLAQLKTEFDGGAPAAGSPAAARAELNAKMADPNWYTRFENGSAEIRTEFNQLLERGKADRVDQIISGTAKVNPFETVTGGEVGTHAQMTAAADLLEHGIKPDEVRRLLTNEKLSRVDYEAVLREEKARLGDKAFVERWLSGDAEAGRVMRLIGIYKVCGYRD
jgi:hypothetical protein